MSKSSSTVNKESPHFIFKPLQMKSTKKVLWIRDQDKLIFKNVLNNHIKA